MSTMNTTRRQVLGGLAALSATGLVGAKSGGNKGEQTKPNILFILVDDMGYSDIGVFGQTDFNTPNLDKLAENGMRFTQAYASSAVCSAARCGLITGRYQDRLEVGLEEPLYKNSTVGLRPSHPTLPSLLKANAGYATALFGKWHLGLLPNFGPIKSGYDEFFGNYGAVAGYFSHKEAPNDPVEDLWENETPVAKAGYYTDLLADRAVEYLATPRTKPFFVSLHFTAPHWPWTGPKDEAIEKGIPPTTGNYLHGDGGDLTTYGKMVESLDAAVGRILHALKINGLQENTIVVFSSDNGGERFSKNWPLSGQKTELLEGGIRVPMIISWPGRIRANQVNDQVTTQLDWLPTLLDAAGTVPHPDYPSDGISLLPVLLGIVGKLERRQPLFWRYHAVAQRAVRSGNWKYLKINNNEFLFDVVVDKRERANLAKKFPNVLATLRDQWEVWNVSMLPFTLTNWTHNISPAIQADHYIYPCPPAGCPVAPLTP